MTIMEGFGLNTSTSLPTQQPTHNKYTFISKTKLLPISAIVLPFTMPQQQSGKSFRSLLGLPDSKPTPNDAVLVIVDAQNEYDHGLLAIHEVEKSRKVIGNVLEKWRGGGGDVVHILHQVPEGAPLFTPGTELAQEFEELRPKDGEEVCTCLPYGGGPKKGRKWLRSVGS